MGTDGSQQAEFERRFDPKRGVGFLRDPLYGYIPYTKPLVPGEPTEEQLIDDPWMQRLRRIRENQWAYMVYPGLQHTRFEHSLGVMHLAGAFARGWYRQWRQAIGDPPLSERHPSVPFVEEMLRIAGLLHDVGHDPFGHTFERASRRFLDGAFPKHEKIGAAIVRRDLRKGIESIRRSPSGIFGKDERLRCEHIACLLDKTSDPQSLGLSPGGAALLAQMRPLISGLFDVDRLDYLRRDAYHGGTVEYGTMDIERLRTTLYFDQDGRIAIPVKSMPALRNMLLARLQMYETVYFHPRVRAFEVEAEQTSARMLHLLAFPKDLDDLGFLEAYRRLDDHWVYGTATQWAGTEQGDKGEVGRAWVALFDRRKRWWCAADISRPIDAGYFGVVTAHMDEVQEALTEYLGKARLSGRTDQGTVWPVSIPSGQPLELLAAIDSPTFEAGIEDFLEAGSPYVLIGEDGRPAEDRTAADILEQVAGVDFVLLRFLAMKELKPVIRDAVTHILGQERFHHLRPPRRFPRGQ